MQHDPAVLQEIQEELERDKRAYEALPPRQQRLVQRIAKYESGMRDILVEGGKAVIGVLELAANVILRLPYVLAGRLIAGIANRAVDVVKLGVGIVSGAGRVLLATGRGGLALASRGIDLLQKKGWLSQSGGAKGEERLKAWGEKLNDWRDNVIAWRKNVSESIDKGWAWAKAGMTKGVVVAAEALEYYGAIGLYRGTKWVLNPRRPSGKPLFGSEMANRVVGLGMAAVLFTGLSFELSKLFILGKIWHIKLAHSFVHDVGIPMSRRVAKQVALQPLLALGLASAKFVSLPIIAAARGALKSTPFTQGLAYQYNVQLGERLARRAARKAERDAKPQTGMKGLARKAGHGTLVVSRYLHKKTLNFVSLFVEHIVEKASPEFYEGRLKHYQSRAAAKSVEAPVPAAVHAAPEASAAVTKLPGLTPSFENAVNDNPKPDAAAPQPAKKPDQNFGM